MAGPGICVLCLAETCASEVHPVFNSVTPYRYLLPNLYLFKQISQIQTCLCYVVGPGLVSTSPAFVRSSASHPAGPQGRLSQKTRYIGPPLLGAEKFDTICTTVCDRCDSSIACRLFRLEPVIIIIVSSNFPLPLFCAFVSYIVEL